MNRLLNRLLDKVNKPAVVLIVLVLVISANGFLFYFYYTRDSGQGPIAEEERGFQRAEGASPGTPKKDAAPKVGRGVVGGGQDEVGLPVRTSAVSPTAPAASQGTAPPSTATPTATASSTAAATAQYAQYATATPTALPPSGGPSLAVPFALVAGLAALVLLRRAPS